MKPTPTQIEVSGFDGCERKTLTFFHRKVVEKPPFEVTETGYVVLHICLA